MYDPSMSPVPVNRRSGQTSSADKNASAETPAGVDAVARGEIVVLVESYDADAEGNLLLGGQFVSAATLSRIASLTAGALYLSLTDERCAELELPAEPGIRNAWQPTPSISLRGPLGSTSSQDDQARTIQAALKSSFGAQDFARGGYVRPLRARPGGTLQRAGRTEAAVDLMRLAGCLPAGVVALVTNEDGTIARGAELSAYCTRHGLQMISVGDVITLRRKTDRLVERVASARIPTAHGEFTAIGYREILNDTNHIALVHGDVAGAEDVLVRVHARCLTGDVFRVATCSCARDLENAIARLGKEGQGVLVYVIPSASLQRLNRHEPACSGGPSASMDEYGIGAQILSDLGLSTIRVLTDHPTSGITGLDGFGLRIVDQLALSPDSEAHGPA